MFPSGINGFKQLLQGDVRRFHLLVNIIVPLDRPMMLFALTESCGLQSYQCPGHNAGCGRTASAKATMTRMKGTRLRVAVVT